MANCTKCGASLREGAKFCGSCGAKVEIQRFCTECGEKLEPGENFCPQCGTPAEGTPVAPQAPAAPVKPTSQAPAAPVEEADPSRFSVEDCDGGCRIAGYAGQWEGDVVIPSYIGGKKVVEIGVCAFVDCKSLTSVTIPNGVTEIGGWVFKDCENLASITIPGSVTEFGAYPNQLVFYGCPRLTIHTPAGSAAAQYAQKCGIPIRPL